MFHLPFLQIMALSVLGYPTTAIIPPTAATTTQIRYTIIHHPSSIILCVVWSLKIFPSLTKAYWFCSQATIFKENLNASTRSRPSEQHPPVSGNMSKRFLVGGGIIGCKDKTFSWHLNGFPDGSNIGSTV